MTSPETPRAGSQPWKSGIIDLAPHHLETVRRILKEHVPACEVRAFGSRVDWTAKDYSDLDLAVVGSGALNADTLARLKEAFEESNLPFRVDVLDWHATSPSFQKVIEKQYEVVQKAQSGSAAGEWRECRLGEVAEVYDGLHATPGKTETGPIFLGISNLSRGRLDLSNTEHLSEEDFERWTRRVTPQAGDVVFSYETRLSVALRARSAPSALGGGVTAAWTNRLAGGESTPSRTKRRTLAAYWLFHSGSTGSGTGCIMGVIGIKWLGNSLSTQRRGRGLQAVQIGPRPVGAGRSKQMWETPPRSS